MAGSSAAGRIGRLAVESNAVRRRRWLAGRTSAVGRITATESNAVGNIGLLAVGCSAVGSIMAEGSSVMDTKR